MNTGNWNIEVNVNGMPQKIASAFEKLGETLVGAEYEFIAYLGSQVVNGTNHAVLAEQIVTTGRDTNNIVVLIFNEKPNVMEATLTGIERVVESGGAMGGTQINIDKNMDMDLADKEIVKIWREAFEGFVGYSIHPIAYLGSQVVNGMNYIYAATMEPMTLEGEKKAVVMTINAMNRQVTAVDMLEVKQGASLKYAFSW